MTSCPPQPQPQPGNSDSNRNVIWYVVGGIAAAALGVFIASRLFPTPERGLPQEPPPSGDPPPVTPVNLPPPGGGAGASAGAPKATTTIARKGFNLPPPGARFVPNEVILDVPPSVSEAQLNAIAGRHAMTRMETQTFRLTGRRLFRWRIDGGTSVPDMIRSVAREGQVAGAQPNYLFPLAQDQLPQMNADQYAPERLNLPEAHKLATGSRVLVAVIDFGIDASHEDLAGAVVRSFDAAAANGSAGNGARRIRTAPAWPARSRRGATCWGIAPRVGVLAVRAFDPRTHSGEGTTFNIIKGVDWAVENGARIINMSFAGPTDPRLSEALDRAAKRGIVLIAAAGNAGPNSPPLYPAADRNVIAVTATDMEDRLFTGRQSRQPHRGGGAGRRHPGAGAGRHLSVHHRHVGRRRPCQRGRGAAARAQPEAHPQRCPQDPDADRQVAWARAIASGAGLVNAYQAVANASAREAGARQAVAGEHRPALDRGPHPVRLHPDTVLPRIGKCLNQRERA